MGLDIRLPIGLMFSLFGIMLAIYGMVTDPALYARSLGYNVNLWWGLFLLVFGLVFLALGRRGLAAMTPAAASPEGQTIEARERAEGLERPAAPPAPEALDEDDGAAL